MLYAVLSLAAAAMAFAGTAIVLAIKGSNHKTESFRQQGFTRKAEHRVEQLEDELLKAERFRKSDKETISALKTRIKSLRELVARYAPNGAGAAEFDRLLQEAQGGHGDGDQDQDDLLEDTLPGHTAPKP